MDSDRLIRSIHALASGEADEEVCRQLLEAVRAGRIVERVGDPTASGAAGVAVAGSVEGATIATGNAVVVTFNSPSAEALRELVRNSLPKPRQLPADIGDFTGRLAEMDTLLRDLTPGSGTDCAVLSGMGGVGKTTLAYRVGHRLAISYPDGQISLNLQGIQSEPLAPSDAMMRVVHAFRPEAPRPVSEAEVQGLYRSILSERRCLVILDDAADADHVAAMIPPPPSSAIVTSRRRLALPGAPSIDLEVMSPDESVTLLANVLKHGNRSAPDDKLARLAERCGYLPLALRAAASFLRVSIDWSVDDYLKELDNERTRLQALSVTGDSSLDVRAILWLSVEQLERKNRGWAEKWAYLSIFPSSFDTSAAAATMDVEELEAKRHLSEFCVRALVTYDEISGRYRLHDLMRDVGIDWLGLAPTDD